MKQEIDSESKLLKWLASPGPAVFQGLDLRKMSGEVSRFNLSGCVFLGCRMNCDLQRAAATASCFVMPPRSDLPFDAFTPGLYTPSELFDAILNGGSYEDCLDRRIYVSCYEPTTRDPKAVDVDVALMHRVHDASIAEALDDILDTPTKLRTVAIMGGHDAGRASSEFKSTAQLALSLTKSGYLIATGGGPGLMEAANLGAYCSGFDDAENKLLEVISKIKDADTYKHPDWLSAAIKAWIEMGTPDSPQTSMSIGIPTWFYGHEPPNVFATHIAKYFENSVREEGLLAVAGAGIIFAKGNGGTVQEIFQDACQNYYRTPPLKKKSPMVLFGTDQWNPQGLDLSNANDKRKPAYPLLLKLAHEKNFADYVLISDDPAEILTFIKNHPPVN
jgi:predicted Rossmann-fold nucleotide-binding protein